MAYSIDPVNGDILVGGFQNGIGSSQLAGLTDAKSVNISSVPGEASTSFSSGPVMSAPRLTNQTTTVTTTNNLLVIPTSSKMESYMWVTFSSVGSSGLSTNTPYLIFYFSSSGGNTNYQLFTKTGGAFPPTALASISGNSSVTWSVVAPGTINYIQKSKANNFALDANGRVWSDRYLTGGQGTGDGNTQSWVYIGNDTDASSNGNGLLLFTTVHDGTGGIVSSTITPTKFDEWLFVWRNSQIDYTKVSTPTGNTSVVWVNGWKPSTGTTGQSNYLNTDSSVVNPHHALVTPDARANYTDGNFLGNFYQNIPNVGSNYAGFDPTNIATYTPANITAVLPAAEVGQCLGFVNAFLLIGTKSNIIYNWDLNPANNTYSTPLIQLPENNTAAIVTVGNNAYIFAGNRGNIYITNGSQASFYKKVPDHISGSPEPLFNWGNGVMTAQCACYQKNRLYFGCNANFQAGGTATGYGGLWCIDLMANQGQGALFNAQEMSYGTYAGYVSAVGMSVAQTADGVSYGPNIGYGLVVGWSDGLTPNYGVDVSLASPYTGTQSYVISDAIPVGTIFQPQTPLQFEYKLSQSLASGESVTISVGTSPTGTFTTAGVTTGSGTQISDNFPSPVQGLQWMFVKATLASKSTNPTYCRLTQLRIKGATSPDASPFQPFAI